MKIPTSLLTLFVISTQLFAQQKPQLGNPKGPTFPIKVKTSLNDQLNSERNTQAWKQQSLRKTPGEVFYEWNFDNDFEGWYQDSINVPSGRPEGYNWTLETDTTLNSGNFGEQRFLSRTQKGFVALEVGEQSMKVGGMPGTQNVWAAFVSPKIDLTETKDNLNDLVLRFHNVFRHCCSASNTIHLQISYDGGNSFLPSNSINLIATEGIGRNEAMDGGNLTQIDLGSDYLYGQADLSNIVFRFLWDGDFDGNNQASDYYYWGIDDLAILNVPDHDIMIDAAFPGNPVDAYDFYKIPQPFIENFYMAARVKNFGTKPTRFRLYTSIKKKNTNEVQVDSTEKFLIAPGESRFFDIQTFTDYVSIGDYKGKWETTFYIKTDRSTPDAFVNALDTFKIPEIEITENILSMAAPWKGETMITQRDFGGTPIPLHALQTVRLPGGVDSAKLTGIAVALHDTIIGNPDSKITVPNELDFFVRTNSGLFDTLPDAFYTNAGEAEYTGKIKLDPSNRERRLSQSTELLPTFIRGDIFNINTDEEFMVITNSDPTYVEVIPSDFINYCVNPGDEDFSSFIYGPYSQGNASYHPARNTFLFELEFESFATSVHELSNSFFALSQNSPNPFNGTTEISYNLQTAGNVSFRVMDITGKVVENRAAERVSAGKHNITVDASNYNSGIYFYTLTVDGESLTKKMLVNK